MRKRKKGNLIDSIGYMEDILVAAMNLISASGLDAQVILAGAVARTMALNVCDKHFRQFLVDTADLYNSAVDDLKRQAEIEKE